MVGLAVARAAAIAGHEVIVAEAADAIGTGVSSRNSEVIHAGLYYPTGSKRAYHCPRARRMLYDFCASHGVPHRKCGKLVVATNERASAERLAAILKQAQINGVEGVEIIDGAAAKRLEPALACVAAHAFAGNRHHRQPPLHAGAARATSKITAAWSRSTRRSSACADATGGWDAAIRRQPIRNALTVDAVVNSAGLGAQQARARDRRLSSRASAAARAGERQLFQLLPDGRRSLG